MIRLYVCAPYRAETVAGIGENIRRVQEFAVQLHAAGFNVFAPHLNTAFMDGAAPDSHFLDCGLEWVQFCHALVIPGPRYSEITAGMAGEICEAESRKVPVLRRYYSPSFRDFVEVIRDSVRERWGEVE